MNFRKLLIVLGVVFGLTMGASEAQAAKGVKKKGGGEHHHHGVVTHVDHKSGHFTIKTHHHGKKKKSSTAAKGTIHHHKFTVTSNTKFTVAHKKNKKPGSFTSLHAGEHVSVAAHKGHADHVTIHAKPKKATKKIPPKKKIK